MPGSTGLPGMPGDSSSTSGLPGDGQSGDGQSGDGKSGDGKSGKGGSSSGASDGDSKSGSATPEGAQTSEERRQAGEKALDDSLGDFDKTLRKEQERVSKERDAKGSASSEGSGSDDGSGYGGGSGDAGGQDRAARSGDLKSTGGPAPKSANNSGDPNAANSSGKGAGGSGAGHQRAREGNDDDIVAKRLRKAAEEETDPELKERLWKEYEDYKKSTS
jgi:hypothetical protein